ncbi:YveK family protein [Nakamurella lactea]|uniref:hypothetical protein n=1 Tax=Nakamurella lactea TaxID=459515 RepID=UPI00042074A6|nr:hypothetical protein [Nakamurella lactea]
MQLKDFGATLLRRWYLLIVALAITIGGTLYIIDYVGPTYEAEGSVLVFPPVETVQRASEDQAIQGNPYLVLNGVSQARDIVIRALTSKSTQEAVATQVPNSSFEATPDFTNSAPIILITAHANTGEDATAALNTVIERVPKILSDLQAGLDLKSAALITSRPLLADKVATVVHKGQIRAGIVAGVGILGVCLLLIGLFDGLMARRRKRADQVAIEAEETAEADELERPSPRTEKGRRRKSPGHRNEPGATKSPPRDADEIAHDIVPGRLRSVNDSGATVEAPKAAQR